MPVGATGAWCAQSAAGCQVLTYAQKPAWPVQSVWLDSVPPGYTFGIAQFNATYSNSPFGCPANCAGCAPTPVVPGQGGGSTGGQGGEPHEPPYQESAPPPPPAAPPQAPFAPRQAMPVDIPPPLPNAAVTLRFGRIQSQAGIHASRTGARSDEMPQSDASAAQCHINATSSVRDEQQNGAPFTGMLRASSSLSLRSVTLSDVIVRNIGPILGNSKRPLGRIQLLGGDDVHIKIGPDFSVVSFIPFKSNWWKDTPQIPEAYLKLKALTRDGESYLTLQGAFELLFESGNPDPPADFSGNKWYEFSKTKEYRNYSSLQQKAVCNDADQTIVTSKSWNAVWNFVGYTPVDLSRALPVGERRAAILGKAVPDARTFSKGLAEYTAYRDGDDKNPIADSPYEASTKAVRASLLAKFRVGQLGNLANVALTGYWAPYAWVRIDSILHCDGSGKCQISASKIPSHKIYKNGEFEKQRSMEDYGVDGLLEFIRAGEDKLAPGEKIADFEWNKT